MRNAHGLPGHVLAQERVADRVELALEIGDQRGTMLISPTCPSASSSPQTPTISCAPRLVALPRSVWASFARLTRPANKRLVNSEEHRFSSGTAVKRGSINKQRRRVIEGR